MSVVKNALYNFPEPKVTFSDVLFSQTNSPKPRDIEFTIKCDKEQQ